MTDGSQPEVSFQERHSAEMDFKLIEKGFTPHPRSSPASSEMWWERQNQFTWPMAATLIAFLVFVVLMLKIP